MAGDIINLRQARKQRDRKQRELESAENRRKFGRTKAEKALDETTGQKAERHLDGHRIGRDDGDREP
ncbi:DUF4169 family protein [Pannonibacter sp. SL95]|jgi:hypothetical protein|uniref:DUF4169 family protein n=1 Tax=Pannonibacter sp. SL95 TaxID=2995153 RepID=UPI0022755F28|nr:DUF4169 family protein [Pannonibacter sp. SL95]MCY1705604.1 DUF4169 family protein [Pannonibacter sp. SL95]